jgi:hypothetical protein
MSLAGPFDKDTISLKFSAQTHFASNGTVRHHTVAVETEELQNWISAAYIADGSNIAT